MPISHSLLGFLAQQPASASELRRNFDTATGNAWPLNQGQVSQTLQRLLRDGLIESQGVTQGETGRSAESFRITESGRAELLSWLRSPVLPAPGERDELIIKIAIAHTTKSHDVTMLIQQQREAVMTHMHAAVRTLRATPRNPGALSVERLILERQIFNLEAENRWLDHIETMKETTP
ncbi:PadR family transcriptional regulator [Corynebacterium sp. H128]|uniref:PadR family transcriptional regulator n=1 Tax=unclassified Corynebacterium TaxID=2624378 RepID=UPI0030A4284A